MDLVQPTKQTPRRFYLSQGFTEQYKNRQPEWGPAGYLVYKRTYSRVKEDKTKEEYWETLKRVTEGVFDIQKRHITENGLTWDDLRAQNTAKKMYNAMWNFKFLPPGRGLHMMGTDYVTERTAAGLFNCAFVSTENLPSRSPEIYEFIMDALMLGIGVGFDTLGADKVKIKEPKESNGGLVFTIPDSREGWVESVGMVFRSFLEGASLPEFDYSIIRKKGEPIKGFGGTASGPEPLMKLHETLTNFFAEKIGETVTAVDIVDLENFISKCVVAGNVRRSAALALGNPKDFDFITMKHDMDKVVSHRHGSNNSVSCVVGMDYEDLAKNSILHGEPGYVWLENAKKNARMGHLSPDNFIMGPNPCGEIILESGELCNLAEIFPANHDTYEDFEETLKLAYLYCKTVTLTKTHWAKTNAKMLKNRRIGLGLGGVVQAINKHGFRELMDWCDRGYNRLQELDEKFSNWLAIPRSKRMTTIKPSGTVSLLCGATPGVHFPHSEYYIRRVTVSNSSPLIPRIQEAGYSVRKYHYDPEKTMVVDIPVHEPLFERSKRDASIWEQLSITASLQKYWADNAVSNTITFKKEEAGSITTALQHFEDKLKSVSFLPLDDHGYVDAPYEEIKDDDPKKPETWQIPDRCMTKEEKYAILTDGLTPLDFSGIIETEISANKEYCDSESCELRRE